MVTESVRIRFDPTKVDSLPVDGEGSTASRAYYIHIVSFYVV